MHARTQIRLAFHDVLKAALDPAVYDVFSSRKYARNLEPGQAIVDIRILNVNVESQVMGFDRTHVASLYIRVQRDEPEETLDDVLDADEVAVTRAIEAHDWSMLLEDETGPELKQVNFSEDSDAAVSVGAIILRYDVEYRIDKTDPTTIRR